MTPLLTARIAAASARCAALLATPAQAERTAAGRRQRAADGAARANELFGDTERLPPQIVVDCDADAASKGVR